MVIFKGGKQPFVFDNKRNEAEECALTTFKFIFYPVTSFFIFFNEFRWQCHLFKPAECYLYLRVY